MKVCLGLSGIFILGGLCNFGRIYLMRVSARDRFSNNKEEMVGA